MPDNQWTIDATLTPDNKLWETRVRTVDGRLIGKGQDTILSAAIQDAITNWLLHGGPHQ